MNLIDDNLLLEHYVKTRDAVAFDELVRRYAGLVYGTCLRVTQNPQDAEDVSQECFLELARRAGTINSSLAGWLHTVAKTRSVNFIKNAIARRSRERTVFVEDSVGTKSVWDEIAHSVDQAVEKLPDELRLPTILHYFHGLDQPEIASQLQVIGIHLLASLSIFAALSTLNAAQPLHLYRKYLCLHIAR